MVNGVVLLLPSDIQCFGCSDQILAFPTHLVLGDDLEKRMIVEYIPLLLESPPIHPVAEYRVDLSLGSIQK